MIKDMIRWCSDLGMFATDRPINDVVDKDGKVIVEGTCIWKTPVCSKRCFDIKLYRLYPKMTDRDIRCEREWQSFKAGDFKKALSRKRKQTQRVSHMTRGEAFKDIDDIFKWEQVCKETPDTLHWMKTRAWHNPILKFYIERILFPVPNLAMNASVDPSDTRNDWERLERNGWNIMFFGDEELTHSPASGKRVFNCPKTHKKMKGHCAICKAGCFSQRTIGRVQVVHLSEH